MKRLISLLLLGTFLYATFYPFIAYAQVMNEASKMTQTAGVANRSQTKDIAITRTTGSVKVLWNPGAFKVDDYIEIVRSPEFPYGSRIVKAAYGFYEDETVTDGNEYQYALTLVSQDGVRKTLKNTTVWFGIREGAALSGTNSIVSYEGFKLNFKGNEFKKNQKVRIRISPNSVEEDSLIQASELFEVTLEDGEQPAVPVVAEISYNTVNMPQGMTENDIRVFLRHDAQSKWEFAKILSIDKSKKIIRAEIPHFSEILAGFIGAPESSQTRANVNTALPKINLQDPFSDMMRVQPAQPNKSGSLSQVIPIMLPEGIAEMTPQLSLVYNSAQKNGLCGYGWALAAGDTISYLKKNGEYVYSGSSGELIQTSSGTISTFRVKYGNSLDLYQYDFSSDKWLIIKDGYTNEYGMNLTNNMPGQSSKQWMLTKKSSPDGVSVDYHYDWSVGGELILDFITYGHFKVEMGWELRPDMFHYSTAFGYFRMMERLTNIQILSDLNEDDVWTIERQYVLSYATNDAGDSLLAGVVMQYGDGSPLSKVEMTYKTNDFDHLIGTNYQTWNSGNPIVEDPQKYNMMDINGDGLKDLIIALDVPDSTNGKFKVYLNNGSSFTNAGYWHMVNGQNIDDFPADRIRFMDMNGDGLPDILANYTGYISSSSSVIWKVFTNSGNSFLSNTGFNFSKTWEPDRCTVMDINGDGKPDFLVNITGQEDVDGMFFKVYTNMTTGIDTNVLNWHYSGATDPSMAGLMGVTGDGLVDLLIQTNMDERTGWRVYQNTGTNFNTSSFYSYSIKKTDPQFVQWMDINGDGMLELVVDNHDGDGTNRTLSVYLNSGTGLTNTNETWVIPEYAPYGMGFQDMNGDGRPDIVINRQDGTVKQDVWLNTGGGFTNRGTIDMQADVPENTSYVDIDGDGASDVVVNNYDGTFKVYKGKQSFNYLLDTITANNMTVAYEYDNVNAGLGFLKTVVKKATMDNGLPESDPGHFTKDAYFAYEQGKYDRLNRVIYGFGKVTSYDALSNRSTAYYSQDCEAMMGRVLTNETWVGTNSVLISRSINDYVTNSIFGGSSRVTLLKSTMNIGWSLDQTESLAKKKEYQYYGVDVVTNTAADDYLMLCRKVDRQEVTGTGYTSNVTALDDTYEEYQYTPENTTGNITPKLCSANSYMIRADASQDKIGETRYFFKGSSTYGTIGNSSLVLMKKSWNGTNTGGSDKWMTSVNRYDASNAWQLAGTTLSNENGLTNGLIKTSDYVYDSTSRFVTCSSNNYGTNDVVIDSSRVTMDQVWGLPLKTIDNNGQTNLFRYDMLGRIIAEYEPGDNFDEFIPQTGLTNIGNITNSAYDQASTLCVYGEADGGLTYTKALKRMTRNDTGTNAFIESIAFLDGMGRTLQTKVSHQDKDTGSRYYVVSGRNDFDGMGRAVKVHEPVGSTDALETYYLYGTNENNPATTTYDELGRILTVTKGSGQDAVTMTNQYAGLYRTVEHDAMGNVKETRKDRYGRVEKILDYVSQSTNSANIYATIDYKYDIYGNLTNTTDISNNVIAISYDYLGRKTGMVDPDMGSWTYQYDDLGRMYKTTDAKGQTSVNGYDSAGRLITKSFLSNEAPTVTYSYGTNSLLNNNGRLLTVSDGSGTESYAYNERGEVTNTSKTVSGSTYITASTFDALGRVDTLVYPYLSGTAASNIIKLKYSYESYSGLLDKIDRVDYAANTNIQSFLKDIKYDVLGRRTAMKYGNDVVTSYTYDSVKSMLSNCVVSNSSTNFKAINYTFDKVGNILVKDDSTEAKTEYTYDDLYRLTVTKYTAYSGGPQGVDYAQTNTYNALGNILSKDVSGSTGNRNYAYAANKPHAVTNFTGLYGSDTNATYTMLYDANGNMTNEKIAYVENGTNKTTTKVITWNGDNQLTAMTWKSVNWGFSYDYTGERVKKVKNEGLTNESKTIYIAGMVQFRTGGNDVYEIYDGVNRIAAVQRVSGQNNTYYMHTDHIGSTSLITKSDGMMYRKVVYKSYGDIYKAWDSSGWHSFSNSDLSAIGGFAFTGQEYDTEIGLYYYGARYYDSFIGRFISADTIIPDKLNSQSFNRYSYCLNNPIVYSDPSGHIEWWEILLGIIVVAAVVTACVITAGLATGAIAIGATGLTAGTVTTAGFGAMLGAGLGAAIGGTYGAIMGYQYGGLGGMILGGIGGGILGGAIGGLVGGLSGYALQLWDPVIKFATYANGVELGSITFGGGISGIGGGGTTLALFGADIWKWDPNPNHSIPGQSSGENRGNDSEKKDLNSDDSDSGEGNGDKNNNDADNLLFDMWSHFQIGGGKSITINASTIDFNYTSQRDLGLDTMKIGETNSVDLYTKTGVNENSLAFGKISLVYEGGDRYKLLPDRFDFNIEWKKGITLRNIGTVIAGCVNYGVNPIIPIIPIIPILFGGPYDIYFSGTTKIPK